MCRHERWVCPGCAQNRPGLERCQNFDPAISSCPDTKPLDPEDQPPLKSKWEYTCRKVGCRFMDPSLAYHPDKPASPESQLFGQSLLKIMHETDSHAPALGAAESPNASLLLATGEPEFTPEHKETTECNINLNDNSLLTTNNGSDSAKHFDSSDAATGVMSPASNSHAERRASDMEPTNRTDSPVVPLTEEDLRKIIILNSKSNDICFDPADPKFWDNTETEVERFLACEENDPKTPTSSFGSSPIVGKKTSQVPVAPRTPSNTNSSLHTASGTPGQTEHPKNEIGQPLTATSEHPCMELETKYKSVAGEAVNHREHGAMAANGSNLAPSSIPWPTKSILDSYQQMELQMALSQSKSDMYQTPSFDLTGLTRMQPHLNHRLDQALSLNNPQSATFFPRASNAGFSGAGIPNRGLSDFPNLVEMQQRQQLQSMAPHLPSSMYTMPAFQNQNNAMASQMQWQAHTPLVRTPMHHQQMYQDMYGSHYSHMGTNHNAQMLLAQLDQSNNASQPTRFASSPETWSSFQAPTYGMQQQVFMLNQPNMPHMPQFAANKRPFSAMTNSKPQTSPQGSAYLNNRLVGQPGAWPPMTPGAPSSSPADAYDTPKKRARVVGAHLETTNLKTPHSLKRKTPTQRHMPTGTTSALGHSQLGRGKLTQKRRNAPAYPSPEQTEESEMSPRNQLNNFGFQGNSTPDDPIDLESTAAGDSFSHEH